MEVMMGKPAKDWAKDFNKTVYIPGQKQGHYESFFLRANNPTEPQAFWIRYTIFSPNLKPEKAIGELWSVYFDGRKESHVAVKKEVPFINCSFSPSVLDVRVDTATLDSGKLVGEASTGRHDISWDMAYSGDSRPLFLLPISMYSAGFPKAKALVPRPMARFNGSLTVDGDRIEVRDWVGSQNHNWGSKHTDLYAWGQVAGFDNSPDSFLEVATARVKIGPLWTPSMTPIVLRHRGEEIALNSVGQTLKAKGSFTYFDWRFASGNDNMELEGRIWADRSKFAGLNYYNPPGGNKYCLNCKIASCDLKITYKVGGRRGTSVLLTTGDRAAFEILTDKSDHGIAVQV